MRLLSLLPVLLATSPALAFPLAGHATLTHYDLPLYYLTSCGCSPYSTLYPTAALSVSAYGSNTSFGPSCGACYRLTLLSTPLSPPPPAGDGFVLSPAQQAKASVVVKVTDLCPGDGSGTDYCAAREGRPNKQGAELHWDLAWPSRGIGKDFFPGDRDYGVWNATYARVPCTEWAGYSDAAAGGSVWELEDAACCPLDPAFDDETEAEDGAASASAESAGAGSAMSSATSASTNATTSSVPSNSTTSSASVSSSSASRNSSATSSSVRAARSTLSARSHLHHHHHKRSPYLANAQTATCPSYSLLAAAGQINTGLVPNTSNPFARTVTDGKGLASGARRGRQMWGWVGVMMKWEGKREKEGEGTPPLLARMEL